MKPAVVGRGHTTTGRGNVRKGQTERRSMSVLGIKESFCSHSSMGSVSSRDVGLSVYGSVKRVAVVVFGVVSGSIGVISGG